MTVTSSTRLGITRWSSGSDPFSRTQMDGSHSTLDNLTAIDLQGTAASRPAAGTRGRFYWATDTLVLSRDTGSAWVDISPFVKDGTVTFAKLDASAQKQVIQTCTSGTRPGSPATGQVIYETDTLVYSMYNGTSWVNITPQSAEVQTQESTASTSYTDLSTVGPTVSAQTGTKALVTLNALFYNSGANNTWVSVAVSGATTIAATDNTALNQGTGGGVSMARTFIISGLTAGVNTFRMKYKVTAGTGQFIWRNIQVVGLP